MENPTADVSSSTHRAAAAATGNSSVLAAAGRPPPASSSQSPGRSLPIAFSFSAVKTGFVPQSFRLCAAELNYCSVIADRYIGETVISMLKRGSFIIIFIALLLSNIALYPVSLACICMDKVFVLNS